MTTLRRLIAVLLTSITASGAPVRVVLLQDKTGSANWTRTPQLVITDFNPLMDLIKTNSGEIALGLIRDSSNRGLLRLRVDLPPVEPPKPVPTGRPFDDMRATKTYRTASTVYQNDLEAWQKRTESEIAAFKSQAVPLLEQKANAPATDVWGALVRADRLLSEPSPGGAPSAHAWLLVASDLYHNAGPARTQGLSIRARLVVINSGQTASLAPLKPVRFEAIAPALRYVVDTEKGAK
jgi:hypothetical protein